MKYVQNIMVVASVAACCALFAIGKPVGTEVTDMEAKTIRGGCRVITTPNCVNCNGSVLGWGQPSSLTEFEADMNNSKICCDTVTCAKTPKNCAGS